MLANSKNTLGWNPWKNTQINSIHIWSHYCSHYSDCSAKKECYLDKQLKDMWAEFQSEKWMRTLMWLILKKKNLDFGRQMLSISCQAFFLLSYSDFLSHQVLYSPLLTQMHNTFAIQNSFTKQIRDFKTHLLKCIWPISSPNMTGLLPRKNLEA